MGKDVETKARLFTGWVLLLLLALSYFFAGKIPQLFSSPEHYFLTINLTAGLAFTALLIYGRRLWPALFVAAIPIQYSLLVDMGGQGNSLVLTLSAMIISLGLCLQALVGVGLVKRFSLYPSSLQSPESIIRFLLCSGPVACLIGTTIGAVVFISVTELALSDALALWYSWWLSDALGILFVSILGLCFLGAPVDAWRSRRLSVGSTAICAFLGTSVLLYMTQYAENTRIRLGFSRQVSVATDAIDKSLREVYEVVYSLERFFTGSTFVSREEFTAFVAPTFTRHPSIQALSWVPRVPFEERETLEAEVRASGIADFSIHEFNQEGVAIQSGERPEYFPVLYCEPSEGNDGVIGYDLASNRDRREALRQAGLTGNLAGTPAVQLVQDSTVSNAMLLFFPVYSGTDRYAYGVPPTDTIEGVISGVFRIKDLVRESLTTVEFLQANICIYDATRGTDESILCSFDAVDGCASDFFDGDVYPHRSAWHQSATLDVGGRTWRMDFNPTENFLHKNRNSLPLILLSGGWGFCFLLCALLLFITGNAARVQRLVELRTEELTVANVDLENEVEQRRRAEELARAASQAKSAFLANMSHELRTPLNAIIGYSEMVHEDLAGLLPDNHGVIADISRIEGSGKHLLALISDILDLSKIEAGGMTISRTWFDVNLLVDEVAATVDPVINENGNTMKTQVDATMSRVYSDRMRISQVLYNLLSNSAKFTQQGLIVLDARCYDDEGKQWLEFAIKDSGIGMTTEEAERIFDPFRQADESTTRKYGGTGLGLTLSRKFATMLGGDLWVQSEPGEGATFTFRVRADDQEVEEGEGDVHSAGMSI